MNNDQNEIIELTVKNEEQANQLKAKSTILDLLKPHLTSNQRSLLEQLYEHARYQHLENFELEEDQSEAFEALSDELEAFLDK